MRVLEMIARTAKTHSSMQRLYLAIVIILSFVITSKVSVAELDDRELAADVAPTAMRAPLNEKMEVVAFISVLGDVPLMNGLTIVEDSLLVFDKPDGRFLEIWAAAQGGLSADKIERYYMASLPALGWRQVSLGEFIRAGETLKLHVEQGGRHGYASEKEDVLVQFTLGPAKK